MTFPLTVILARVCEFFFHYFKTFRDNDKRETRQRIVKEFRNNLYAFFLYARESSRREYFLPARHHGCDNYRRQDFVPFFI